MNPYDEIRYPSYAHPQSHPDRLAVAGRLLGLSPAPPDRCRVLEFGCGDGTNLLTAALGAPESQFVGIDLAEDTIAEGRAAARDLALPNVDLRVGDIAALDPGLGEFDYVVAHGVYSWIPAPVRDALLAAVRRHLRPTGIAFVSYSCYPGAHVRQMVRDVLLFHVRAVSEPAARVRESVRFLRFLREGTVAPGPFGDFLRHELEGHADSHESLIRHDLLSEVNEPVWFHEFARHAAGHGLRYLAEADWFEESDVGFPAATRKALAPLARDVVLRSQYLDFLKCRRFRQSLLVPSATPPAAEPDPGVVAGFRVASPARPVGDGPDGGGVETFVGVQGGKAATDSPLGRAALRILGEAWPRSIPFAELHSQAAAAAGAAATARGEGPELLARFLSALHDSGLVSFRILPSISVAVAGERPVASPIARRQLRAGVPVVCTLEGPVVGFDDAIGPALLALLDGTRDRAALARDLAPALPAGAPPVDLSHLESALGRLAQAGLLLA